MRIVRPLVLSSVGLAALVTACTSPEPSPSRAPETATALQALVETIDGVAFYPPLGPEPSPVGTFDASLLGGMQVVLEATDTAGTTSAVATFDQSTATPLRVFPSFGVYMVDVPAATYFTNSALAYRFRVISAGVELGRSDLSSRVFEILATNPALTVGVKVWVQLRPAPVLTDLAPSLVTAGDPSVDIHVHGGDFTRDSVAYLDATLLSTTFVSATELVATVPAALIASPGTHAISVVKPAPGGGTSGSALLTVQSPAPTLVSIAPGNATAGSGSFVLTASGANFTSGARVIFGGAPIATTFVSSTLLTAVVPASAIATPGSYGVTVENPAPSAGASNLLSFGVSVPANPTPTLTSIVPTGAQTGSANVALTLNGSGFVSGASVSFGALALATTFVSATQLTAIIPSSSLTAESSAAVTVTNPTPGGGTSGAATFTVFAGARQAVMGLDHSCVLRSNGTVRCLGYNDLGTVGDGTTTHRFTAVPVSGISTATQISAGQFHNCVRLADSTAWCWGANLNGQLGNTGAGGQANVPVRVATGLGLTSVAEVQCGASFTCGRRPDGRVYCWGRGDEGQLGYGSSISQGLPATVSNITTAQQIAAGIDFACARLADGTVRCWGYGFGNTPVAIAGLSNVTNIGAGGRAACAIRSDGTAHCWGQNYWGNLGNGTNIDSSTPVQVNTISNVVSITQYSDSACALLGDTSVWCWGRNFYGQLGSPVGDRTSPVQVGGLSGVSWLGTGNDAAHVVVVLSDGTVRSWGWNVWHQLADGTNINRSSPVVASF